MTSRNEVPEGLIIKNITSIKCVLDPLYPPLHLFTLVPWPNIWVTTLPPIYVTPLPVFPVYFDYVQNQHLDELYIRSLGNTTSIKSNEVFLNSANNGNKRRNLMRIKILYSEVNLPLHICYVIHVQPLSAI